MQVLYKRSPLKIIKGVVTEICIRKTRVRLYLVTIMHDKVEIEETLINCLKILQGSST
jgi:hypothetical protein